MATDNPPIHHKAVNYPSLNNISAAALKQMKAFPLEIHQCISFLWI